MNDKKMNFITRLSNRKIAFLIGFAAEAIGGLLGLLTSNFGVFIIGVTCLYGIAISRWLSVESGKGTKYGTTVGVLFTTLYLAWLVAHGNPCRTENFQYVSLHGVFIGPPIMSGFIAALLGAKRRNWTSKILDCFIQGTVAGTLLCFLHILFCAVISAIVPSLPVVSAIGYILLPVALGAASTIYLPIMNMIVIGQTESQPETAFNAAATAWVDKLTIAKSGVILFVLMVLAGVGWAGIFR
jgi:hypothetical protein